jgi:hypothetical protein
MFEYLQETIEIRMESIFIELDILEENLIKQVDLFEKRIVKNKRSKVATKFVITEKKCFKKVLKSFKRYNSIYNSIGSLILQF